MILGIFYPERKGMKSRVHQYNSVLLLFSRFYHFRSNKAKEWEKKTRKGKECISWKTLHEPSHQHENRIGPIIFIFLFLSMYSFLSSLHQDAGLLFFYDHKKVKTNRKEWVAIHATAFQNFRSIIGLTNNENFSYGDMTSYKYKYWKLFSLGFVSLR